MSDAGRDRRRVGDHTRQRIDNLAEGWSVDDSSDELAPAAPSTQRSSSPLPPPTRSKRPSMPPPVPPRRAKRISDAPPAELAAATPAPAAPRTPPIVVDTALAEEALAETALGLPRPEPTPAPAPTPSGRDDDATVLDTGDDALPVLGRDDRSSPGMDSRSVPRSTGSYGTLRPQQTLPKRPGLLGDVGYVFTVLLGLTETRRELNGARREIEREQHERDERVLDLARQSVADERLELPTVTAAREELAELEDRRSRRAGAVASSDAELESIRAERAAEAERNAAEVRRLEKELSAIEDRLLPLERQAYRARRKAAELRQGLERLDARIAAAQAAPASGGKARKTPAAVEAELASLRAERQSVAGDEPVIAGELDNLEPKIASLTHARREARRRIQELRADEKEAQVRADEQTAAVKARKIVEERAIADADRERARALRRLGEALCAERPEALAARLHAIEEHDVCLATLERRAHDLEEVVAGIDRLALLRGGALLVLGLAAVLAPVLFVLLR